MAKRRRKYRPIRIAARDAGKVKCERVKDNWLCAHAGKYGVSVRLYAKGQSPPRDSADWYRPGNWLPVSEGRARTVTSALRAGRQFVRRVKMKSKGR